MLSIIDFLLNIPASIWKVQTQEDTLSPASTSISSARVVSVVALRTGGGHQVDGMTVGASGTLVIEAVTFPTIGMRTTVAGFPIVGRVALGAIRAEEAGVIGRVGVTGDTGRGKSGEEISRMTPCAGQTSMCTS